MTPCTLLHRDYCFGGICCLHLQRGRRQPIAMKHFSPSNYRRHRVATPHPPPSSKCSPQHLSVVPPLTVNAVSQDQVRTISIELFNTVSQDHVRTINIELTRLDTDSRKIGTAASAALPAVTRDALSYRRALTGGGGGLPACSRPQIEA